MKIITLEEHFQLAEIKNAPEFLRNSGPGPALAKICSKLPISIVAPPMIPIQWNHAFLRDERRSIVARNMLQMPVKML